MLTLYSILIRLAVPVILLRLLWRSRHNPGYRQRWWQRLGLGLPDTADLEAPLVWVHAVSVGETLAVAPLIESLLAAGQRVLVTSTTPTGAAQVARLFGARVASAWVPIDTPGAVGRCLTHWQPRLVVLVETEIWPNLVLRSRARGVPVVLLNARLSVRSARGYARIGALTRRVLAGFSAIAAQGRGDARRFRALGADPSRTSVVGSIKYDVDTGALSARSGELAAALAIGAQRLVWVAASTHEGEDAPVLAAHQRLLAEQPEALLVLAPRHPERADDVAQRVAARGLDCQRRSAHTPIADTTAVLILDTLGELSAVFPLAALAFIGGSLVPHGGHNPLDAQALGVATITGPYTHNFTAIYRELIAAGGVRPVADGDGLAAAVVALASAPDRRRAMGAAGAKVVARNRGALARQRTLVAAYLD